MDLEEGLYHVMDAFFLYAFVCIVEHLPPP